MMRFMTVFLGILLTTAAAAAHPTLSPRQPVAPPRVSSAHVLLDLAHLHLFHLFHPADASANAAPATAGHAQDWSRQAAPLDFSMGPLHPKFGQDDNPVSGLSAFEAQDQLGSSAWKDQENRSHSAKLMFIWPTDK